jgi:hypothetical protein
MASSSHCHSSQIALAVGGRATPASTRRRWERLLDNQHLHPQSLFEKLCRFLGRAWAGRRVVLIIDETDRDGRLRSLRIGLGYHQRMLPLLSIPYPPDAPPLPLPQLLKRQLSLVHRWLGNALQVTVLADRGLAWPVLVRLCRRFGWHFVLRLQSQTRFRSAGGEQSLGELAPRGGSRCRCIAGEVFKKQGWMKVEVTAVWEKRCKQPWLLISDRKGGYHCCRTYCKRMWCEESFRDEKSGGFQWRRSCVNDLAHAARLLLLMALATLLCIAMGVTLVRRSLRRVLDPHRVRQLSYFQLGRRWLAWIQQERATPPLSLSLPPP